MFDNERGKGEVVMTIKFGKLHRDTTSFGHQYWIQINDDTMENADLKSLVDQPVTIIIGDVTAAIDFSVESIEANRIAKVKQVSEEMGF